MTDKPQRPKHPKPLPPGPQFPGALRSPPHSTEPLPKPPIPRPRMAEGYQPKFPPGVDIEKVKANPPRGGSGARKKPTGTEVVQPVTDNPDRVIVDEIMPQLVEYYDDLYNSHPRRPGEIDGDGADPISIIIEALRKARQQGASQAAEQWIPRVNALSEKLKEFEDLKATALKAERLLHDFVATDATVAIQEREEIRQQRDALAAQLETLKAALRSESCDYRNVHPVEELTCRDAGTPRKDWCAACLVADMEQE